MRPTDELQCQEVNLAGLWKLNLTTFHLAQADHFQPGILSDIRLLYLINQSTVASSGLRASTSSGEAIARLVSLPVIR
jgi:hypothetical protein